MKNTLLWFVLWLIITQGFAWFAFNRLYITEPDKKDCSVENSCQYFDAHPLNFLEMHARQDSAWYFSIAYEGYTFSKDRQSNVNFFPLYPMLMRSGSTLLKPITPNLLMYHRYLLAGTIISVLSAFLAVIMLHKLLRIDADEKIAFLAIFLLLIFPTAYFLTAIYTESLFLLLAISAFYCARKKQFVFASLIGFLAALTRPVGVLLLLPIAIELFAQRGKMSQKAFIVSLGSLLLIPLGLGTYMYYLQHAFGNPLLFLDAAQQWGRDLGAARSANTFTSLIHFIGRELRFNHASAANTMLEIVFFTFGLVASVYVLLKERLSYGIWCVISVLFPLTSGILVSQGRYTLVLFPIFLAIARVIKNNALLQSSYLMISMLLFGLLTVLFVNGHWSY